MVDFRKWYMYLAMTLLAHMLPPLILTHTALGYITVSVGGGQRHSHIINPRHLR
jgi:hypothetical protein